MEIISRLKTWVQSRRAIRGGMWLGVGSGAENGLRFLRNIILARILAPEAFGAIAIVLAINALLESFTEVGIKEAIIQNPRGKERAFLNGAWWIALGRSVFLYAAAFVSAPFIAGFYGNPELVPLMRVVFLSILFNGFMSSAAYVAVKQMAFGRWVLLFHGGSAVGIVATIGLAFAMRNVWALAIGFALEAFFRTILSYALCPFRPGLEFDRESTRSMMRYSRGMVGLPILTFVFMRADIFVVGKLCTIEQLGLYSMAAALARIPSQFISSIASRIVMPMFSEIQEDAVRVNVLLLKFTSAIMLLVCPMLAFVALYGGDVLRLTYGARYAIVAAPFVVVFAAELLRVGSVPIVAYYLGSGRPELHRLFTAVRAALMLILIYPATKAFGLEGAAAAGLVATAAGYVIQVRLINKLTGLDLKHYALLHLRAAAISLCVVLFWAVARIVPSVPSSAQVAIGLFGCLLSYGVAIRQFMNEGKGSTAT